MTRVLTKRSRALWTTAVLAMAALWSAADLRAQLPMPASTLFEMTGFIQSATLDGAEKSERSVLAADTSR